MRGSDPYTKDQKHRAELAKQYDQYREEYKKKLTPTDYPGNLSLIFELDTKVCLITTDDTTYVGELSSFDHFGNVVLAKTTAKYAQGGEIVERRLDNVFFRAEQIELIGKIDPKKENKMYISMYWLCLGILC